MLSQLTNEFVEYMPEKMQDGVLYFSEKYELAIHLCPCGCGNKVVTPTDDTYGWKITINDDKITLHPSIGNWQFPCKSHYFLKENKIEWC